MERSGARPRAGPHTLRTRDRQPLEAGVLRRGRLARGQPRRAQHRQAQPPTHPNHREAPRRPDRPHLQCRLGSAVVPKNGTSPTPAAPAVWSRRTLCAPGAARHGDRDLIEARGSVAIPEVQHVSPQDPRVDGGLLSAALFAQPVRLYSERHLRGRPELLDLGDHFRSRQLTRTLSAAVVLMSRGMVVALSSGAYVQILA
jgi:hypothetical protein